MCRSGQLSAAKRGCCHRQQPLSLLPAQFALTFYGLQHIFPAAKGGKAEEPLPLLPEACAGGTHNTVLLQKVVEKLPRSHAARVLQPDVGGVSAAREPQAQFLQGSGDKASVFHVILNVLLGLLQPVVSEDGRGGSLDDVGHSVELGGLTPKPQLVQ